jgi:hypothetical protein
MNYIPKSLWRYLCPCLLSCLLYGCGGENSTTEMHIQDDGISLDVPNRIRQVQALDIERVEAIATVAGQQFQLNRTGEQFRISLSIPANSTVDVSILFQERLDDGGILELTRHTSTLSLGSSNQTLQLFDDDFDDTPFDNDNDQISNLAEREQDTDPFEFNNPTDPGPETRNFTIRFALPTIINDPQITQVIATIAGTPRAVRRDGNDFEITGVATTRQSVRVEVILLQRLDSGVSLILANAVRTIPVGVQAVSIELTDNEFDFSRDQDGDGRTNLEEVQNGTDPTRPD